jgi:hypothetical protein
MPRPEALKHHAPFEFVVGLIQLALDFVRLDFNRKFAPEMTGFFYIYIHDCLTNTDKHTPRAWINKALTP